MTCYLEKVIVITVILAIVVPISRSHREKWRGWEESDKDTEQQLRDLCMRTNRSEECELYRFGDSDDRTIANAVIDLAIAKSNEIHHNLNQYYSNSKNDKLKEKYISCSKNYNDINRNLVVARRDVDSDDRRNIPVQLGDAQQELNNCKREFKKESFHPAYIGDRNKEIELYFMLQQTI